ncbi:MAG: hypothetical protein ACAI35_24470 [Candidatus Methylacidiphilales bacterium]
MPYILEQSNGANECCKECSERVSPCDSCKPLEIWYEWSGFEDLDTGTTYNGEKVGWSCGDGSIYMTWQVDNTSGGGPEYVTVDLAKAKKNGVWTSSTSISCASGWHRPEGDDRPIGGATLHVRYRGQDKYKSLSPGKKSGCATGAVRTITVTSTGTFTIS